MQDSEVFSPSQVVPAFPYRPPSLILSPTKNDRTSETTPSALDSHWLQLAPNQQGSPRDSASTASSHGEDAAHSTTHPVHSRGSSTTSNTSLDHNIDLSLSSKTMHDPLSPDVAIGIMPNERPHSFSGGISQSDLRRLQTLPTKGQPPSPISTLTRLDGPRTSPPKENLTDTWNENKSTPVNPNSITTPPRYPSLGDHPADFPSIQQGGELIGTNGFQPNRNLDPNLSFSDPHGQQQPQRGFGDSASGLSQPRAANEAHYRQSRNAVSAAYAPQPMMPPSSPYMYPTARPPALDRNQPAFAHHNSTYYEMNSPGATARRDSQLHLRGSATSPLPMFSPGLQTPQVANALRNPAPVIMNGIPPMPYVGMSMPANGLYTPPANSTSPIGATFPQYGSPNPQFYHNAAAVAAASTAYSAADQLSGAMGRLNISPSFNGVASPYHNDGESVASAQTGPSANNRKLGLYKTELCRSWEEKGSCRYGAKCQFAHSEGELRKVSRHPKYKTEICRTFWVSGSCPYGKRCCFIHTELPAGGTPPGADGSSPPKLNVGMPSDGPMGGANRDRSASNASGGGEAPTISLLQRISAQQRENAAQNVMSPSDHLSPASYHFAKPTGGALRLDTSGLQQKTSYPLTSNPALGSTDHQNSAMSPVLPATAGPDFGRQSSARVEVVGYNNPGGVGPQRGLVGTKTGRDGSLRHSFNGTEMGISIASPITTNTSSHAHTPVSPDSAQTPTNTNAGHQRAESAGQWPSAGLNSLNSQGGGTITSPTYITNPSSNVERNSPWGMTDLGTNNRKRLSGTWL